MTTFPLYEQIKTIFKDTEFTSSEGEFLTGKIFEAIEKLDKNFITILLQNEVTKSHFFDVIEEAYVLNQNKLYDFFNAKEYFDHSYTSYSNKIGLIKKDSFIKKCDDVVLAFPYKDCVLEGGMSNEEASKKEVFYNAIISKEEIDRLFEPKVLTNISKFDTNGQSTPKTLSMNDNLILKGNNLLALHSLKQRYAGQIKLIYIDPPYNRKRLKANKKDSFKYNDRFNHSTWLTFMKNRLEIAFDLLKDEGSIFVSCDNAEFSYLQILMEEIFESRNFISCLIWEKGKEGGNDSPFIGIHHDYILFFTKNNKNFNIELDEKDISRHISKLPEENLVTEPLKPYKDGEPFQLINLSKQKDYNLVIPLKDGTTLNWEGYMPQTTLDTFLNEGRIFVNSKKTPYVKSFLSDEVEGSKPSTLLKGKGMTTKAGGKENIALFGGKTFDYPKPEALIKRIIEISTQENDIVLDYHLGSGTTCAVAHKMNRRYIGIEQMDYIETIAVERMKKVIEGEQGGISKAVEWKGGGSFVYAELKTIDTFNEADTIGALNQNMRYLPLGEMDDEIYGISESEKALNKQFYGVE